MNYQYEKERSPNHVCVIYSIKLESMIHKEVEERAHVERACPFPTERASGFR